MDVNRSERLKVGRSFPIERYSPGVVSAANRPSRSRCVTLFGKNNHRSKLSSIGKTSRDRDHHSTRLRVSFGKRNLRKIEHGVSRSF